MKACLLCLISQWWLYEVEDMNDRPKRGWTWAYRLIRSLKCSPLSAAYRATLYVTRGDTGTFYSGTTYKEYRFRRNTL